MTGPGLPRCYIASPLGFTEAGRAYYQSTYLPALLRVVEPVDPWSAISLSRAPSRASDGGERAFWLEASARNAAAIRTCGMLAAYLEGQEVDCGTAAEVGYAAGLGLRCFGLRSDLRQAGEAGMALNLQVEGFIIQSGGSVVSSLAALVRALRRT